MTSRSRFIPLFILSVMFALCPATAMFSVTVFPTSSAPAWGNLLVTVLILFGLLAGSTVSGLLGDLIHATTEQPDGMRNVRVLVTIVSGILAGILCGGLCSWLATMWPRD